ncbi:MAG: carboxypeptidase-like regulatory domain-containing protein, partial [Bacteroidota bacterium]
MKQAVYLFLFFLGMMGGLFAQSQSSGQLRGRVVSEAGEPLVGARVWIPQLKIGGYTNDQGIYSISRGISPGEYEVSATYYGYDTLTKKVTFISNGVTVTVGFALKLVEVYTDAVEITSQKQTGEINKTEVDIGITSITPKEIN